MQVSNSKPASAFLKRRFMKEKNGTEICTLKNGEKDNMRISNIIKEGRKNKWIATLLKMGKSDEMKSSIFDKRI